VFKHGHHDDQNKNIFQLVRDHGYFIKSYKYETGDGYINTVFRVMPKTSAQLSSHIDVTNCDGTFQKIDPAFNRTPNPKIFTLNAVKPDLGQVTNVVILQHDFLQSGAEWMMNGK